MKAHLLIEGREWLNQILTYVYRLLVNEFDKYVLSKKIHDYYVILFLCVDDVLTLEPNLTILLGIIVGNHSTDN